jgi:RHS repeat-associated protein
VTVTVNDGNGGLDSQTFTLVVHRPGFDNQPPHFTSQPVTTAQAEVRYTYPATATDPDGDPLLFDLPVHPDGMVLSGSQGLIVWVPTFGQVGTADVLLRVRDDHGGVDLQPFKITVAPPDNFPVITSQPPLHAVEAIPYEYRVRAQDADDDPLTYSLQPGSPTGMMIDPQTGVLSWPSPVFIQGASQSIWPVGVVVSDGRGGSATQPFDLTVDPLGNNHDPVIDSHPRATINLGLTYYYQVVATDDDPDPLTFSLGNDAPAGMMIDMHTGLVTWHPSAANARHAYPIHVHVSDGRGPGADQPEPLTVTVLDQAANQAPVITSTPRLHGTVGKPYAYDVAAHDPDGDLLTYTLATAPFGLSINHQYGTIRWTPRREQAGDNAVVVRVSDPYGGATTQSFVIHVGAVNLPPQITSTPPEQATVGHPYRYAIRATDPDEDTPLHFSLEQPAPGNSFGIQLDPDTGVLTWVPPGTGDLTIVVQVSDGWGGTDSQTYPLHIAAQPPNLPPEIASAPPEAATVGETYTYQVLASDPDGDPLTYGLDAPVPSGMAFSPSPPGLLTWTPQAAQTVTVALRVTDPAGAAATQTYTLTAAVDDGPYFESTPTNATITAGLVYRYDVQAKDDDGDALTYALPTHPDGMTIDAATGRITWATGIPDIATSPHTVTVKVTDTHQKSVASTYAITVVADTEAPSLELQIHDNPTTPGTPVTFLVLATDNVGVTGRTLTVGGPDMNVSLDASGAATLTLGTPGLYAVHATASDAAGNTADADATLRVLDPNEAAPQLALTSPADGATVTAPTAVTGSVSGDSTLTWTLEVLALDGSFRRTIASGSGSVSNATLGTFDPTLLRDDGYSLRLSASDLGGDAAVTRAINVAGHLKLGNFTLSVTDLTIPVAGIPITVGRTYDTLQANADSGLGFGWRLNLADADLQVNLPAGAGQGYGSYPGFLDGTRVSLTLPDGDRQGFTFQPVEVNTFFGLWAPVYVPDTGNVMGLTVPDVQLYRDPDSGEYFSYDESGLHTYNPADPAYGDAYTLLSPEGLHYDLYAQDGRLMRESDRKGNELTFTDDGITSNRGKAVQFERDAQGRIVALIDPRGNKMQYQYNGQGELVSVTDRDGNVRNRYSYQSGPDSPHSLETVTDALGNRKVQTQYQADGRLTQLQDAADQALSFTYDVTAHTENIAEPGQNPYALTFDARGNVVRQQDPEGGVTLYTYNTQDRQTSSTQVVGQNDLTTSFTFDAQGNVLTATNPAGGVYRMTYGPDAELQTISDPLGNTTTLTFDANGNLTSRVSPDGQTLQFGYDAQSNPQALAINGAHGTSTFTAEGYLQTETNPDHVTTTYTYDANGNRTETTYHWVNPDPPHDVRPVTKTLRYDNNDRPTATTTATGTVKTEYDALGRPFRTTDQFGLVTELTYDQRGLVIQTRSESRDAAGAVAWLLNRTVYDAIGRVAVATDQYVEGSTSPVWATRYTYDGAGRTTVLEQLKGVVIDLVGSGSSLVAQLTDPGTVIWSTSAHYDDAGRLVQSIDRYGTIRLTAYDKAGRVIETRAQGRDENDHLVWQVTRTVYDEHSRPIVVTDPFLVSADGNDTVLTATITGKRQVYDDLGRVKQTLKLYGLAVDVVAGETVLTQAGTVVATTTTVYGDKGRVQETIDGNGRTTDFAYDDQGRVVTTLDSPVPIDGVLVRNRTETIYDDYGQVRVQRTNIGQLADGTIDSTSAQETQYSYDENGRPTTTTFADGTSTSTQYDGFGRAITQVDQRGLETSFGYDTLSRLAEVQLPPVPDPDHGNQLADPSTDYYYDAKGNLVTIRDALLRETTFTYDERGHQLTRTLPAGPTERTEYCDCGRPVLHVSFEGVVTQYVYDDRPGSDGRLAALRYFPSEAAYNNGQGTPAETVSYRYDGLGRVIQITDDRGGSQQVWTIAYDPEGRVLREVSPQGAINYEYDLRSGLRTRTFTGTSGSYAGDQANPVNDTHYAYDVLGRLFQVTVMARAGVALAQPEVTTYVYDLVGNVVRMTTPDGIITVYTYDPLNRLTHLTKYLPDATPLDLSDNPKLAAFDYVLRTDGLRQSATETFWFADSGGGTATPHQNTIDWSYDNDGRLIEEVFRGYDPSLSQTEDFVYDLVGNRREMTIDKGNDGTVDETIAYQYDANDRLLTEQADLDNNGTVDQTTTYDYTGTQQTDKTVHAGGPTGLKTEETVFAYDLQGRLSQAAVTTFTAGGPSRIERTSYAYGPDGNRVSALDEVDADADTVFETRTRTDYLVDKPNDTGYAQVIQETTTNADTGAAVKQVVYTTGLDVISQTTFLPGGPAAGTTLVLQADGGGSTRLLTDLAGAIAQDQGVRQIFHYDGFGNALGFDPAAALTSLLYRGQQFDRPTGMQYLRARYYDPATARFNQLDPFFGELGDPLSLHKYKYAHGDPINFWDPSGMLAEADPLIATSIGTKIVQVNASIALNASRTSKTLNLLRWVIRAALSTNVIDTGYEQTISEAAWLRAQAAEAAFTDAAQELADIAAESVTQEALEPIDRMLKRMTEVATQFIEDECPDWTIPILDNHGRKWIGIRVTHDPPPGEEFSHNPGTLWSAFLAHYAPGGNPPQRPIWVRDHFIPKSLGGSGEEWNINPLSADANADGKTLDEGAWRQSRRGCIAYAKIVDYGFALPQPGLGGLQPPLWMVIAYGPLPQPLGGLAQPGGGLVINT